MADILPSRIEPLGDSADVPQDSRRDRPAKPKSAEKPIPVPPPIDTEKEESHQLDELA